jgi:hypothetical protein
MATERRDIALSIIADTKRYQQELAKLPKMTDEAASQAAVMAIKQQIREENEKARIRKKAIADRLREEKKADRERTQNAEKANREIETSYRNQFSSIKGLSNAAFGGMAGDVFDLVEVVEGASGGMAALGAGLAALAIGAEVIPRIVEHMAGLAEAGIEARDKISEAGIELGSVFTPAQLQALSDYEEGLKANELAMAALAVETGAAAADTGLLISKIELMAQIAQNDSAPAMDTLTDSVSSFATQLAAQTVPGRLLLQYLNDLGVRADDASDKLGKLAEEAAKQKKEMEDNEAHAEFIENIADAYEALGLSYGPVVSETKKATKAQSAYVEAVKRGRIEISDGISAEMRAREAAQTEQERIASEAVATMEEEFKAEMALERERQLFLAESHARELAQEEEKKRSREERREELEQEMLALADLTGVAVGAAAAFQDLKFQATREGAEKATEKADKLKQEIEDLRGTIEGANAAERREIQQTIRDKEDELATAEAEAKQARRLARKQFKDMKGLRISETIINGAAAAARAYVELGPVLGAIAAAGIATTTAVQVATIKAQKPPKFHMGGLVEPDEQISVLRRGEAVLNERAAQRLGRQTIESLNRDEPLGNVNIYLGEDLLRSQRLQRTLRSGAHSAVGARSPYIGR